MRCFIAIPIPENICKEIINVQLSFSEFGLSLSSQFHLTLDFLGEISENELNFIIKKLAKFEFDSFYFTISKIGFFPGLSHPKIMWVSSSDKRETHLCSNLAQRLLVHLIRREHSDLVPHITFARVINSLDRKKFLQAFSRLRFGKKSFKIDSIILYKSEFNGEKHVYSELLKIDAKQ